jgi:hypothetical protein
MNTGELKVTNACISHHLENIHFCNVMMKTMSDTRNYCQNAILRPLLASIVKKVKLNILFIH